LNGAESRTNSGVAREAGGETTQTGDETGPEAGELDATGEDAEQSGGEIVQNGEGAGQNSGEPSAQPASANGRDDSRENGDGVGPEAVPGIAAGAQNFPGFDTGVTTAARRAATQDRLDASFAVIARAALGERQRVQRAANAAGTVANGTLGAGDEERSGGAGTLGASVESGGGGDGTGERPAALATNTGGTGGGVMPRGNFARPGDFDEGNMAVTYPVPVDIPSGDNDDVVARQLREAALREANPELREKLWDEYRSYGGLIEK
jgi:hypothetical protein